LLLALNGVEEGKAGWEKEVASSKKNRIGAKIDTLFMTKMGVLPEKLGMGVRPESKPLPYL